MLWNASALTGYGIEATDGSIGSASDFLFDDETWTIRWIVVDTSALFAGRRVLLPPSAIQSVDAGRRALAVGVTRQQVKDSPDIATDAPVSRRQESDLYTHYGWDPYWAGYIYAPTGGTAAPIEPPPTARENRPDTDRRSEGDPHLRSITEVTGYYIQASDGDIGHVEEFLVDSDAWAIRYVVVDTKNWWPGKKVLVPPNAFTGIDWAEQTVRVGLSRDQVRQGPEYDPAQTVDRAYEERYYDYYGYPLLLEIAVRHCSQQFSHLRSGLDRKKRRDSGFGGPAHCAGRVASSLSLPPSTGPLAGRHAAALPLIGLIVVFRSDRLPVAMGPAAGSRSTTLRLPARPRSRWTGRGVMLPALPS
jgi:hypothetical protein